MWVLIALAAGALLGLISFILYLSFRTARFPFVLRIVGGRKKAAVLVSIVFYLAVGVILYLTMGIVNTVICFVHLGGFWLLSELIFRLVGKKTHRNISSYLPGVTAIVFTVCYLAIAWYLCNHVWEKTYQLKSPKLEGDLRIVQISDSHVGTTFDAQGLHDYVLQINELHPDLVVITGDFVDDDTSREDMIGSCGALGDLETEYGVYFCYGNHDRGYFSEEARSWSNAELAENLEKNDVIVLEDESRLVDGRFYVIGRKDRSDAFGDAQRKTPAQLMEGLDPDLYKIVLDHQPCEYDELAQAGADLVLGGHTHGGHFFPVNELGVLTDQYDRCYGHEQRGGTDFIVSSGISDWRLLFKTGCRSEYVVIDINKEG